MRLTRGTLVALVVGVIAVYAVTTTGTEHASEPTINDEMSSHAGANEARPGRDAVANEQEMPRRAAVETELARRSSSVPASLSGTDPDGDLTVTVSRGTIRLFDYYLTTLGETDLAGVRSLVTAEAQRQSPDTATEVLALFDRYTAYLEDLQDVHVSTLDDYFAQTVALQHRHFGADADTLFGDDNALAARLLASASTTPGAAMDPGDR